MAGRFDISFQFKDWANNTMNIATVIPSEYYLDSISCEGVVPDPGYTPPTTFEVLFLSQNRQQFTIAFAKYGHMDYWASRNISLMLQGGFDNDKAFCQQNGVFVSDDLDKTKVDGRITLSFRLRPATGGGFDPSVPMLIQRDVPKYPAATPL